MHCIAKGGTGRFAKMSAAAAVNGAFQRVRACVRTQARMPAPVLQCMQLHLLSSTAACGSALWRFCRVERSGCDYSKPVQQLCPATCGLCDRELQSAELRSQTGKGTHEQDSALQSQVSMPVFDNVVDATNKKQRQWLRSKKALGAQSRVRLASCQQHTLVDPYVILCKAYAMMPSHAQPAT